MWDIGVNLPFLTRSGFWVSSNEGFRDEFFRDEFFRDEASEMSSVVFPCLKFLGESLCRIDIISFLNVCTV